MKAEQEIRRIIEKLEKRIKRLEVRKHKISGVTIANIDIEVRIYNLERAINILRWVLEEGGEKNGRK